MHHNPENTPFVLTIPLNQKIAIMRKVFELLANFWSERRDLNSGPPVPQTGALTGLRNRLPKRSGVVARSFDLALHRHVSSVWAARSPALRQSPGSKEWSGKAGAARGTPQPT